MAMFRKKRKVLEYDAEHQKPIIRCSICTGEKTAGFKNLQTGRFTEVVLIRTDEDLEEFKRLYGISEIEKEY
ncbi:MAG: aspartate dehydrogenase [Clostridiales bacterium]|nr:aspartate dehydrogenase [Clostridiales bacterium]